MTFMRQLGQFPETQSSPLGRWYLKLREKMRIPEARRAEPTVSPGWACMVLPSNWKEMRPLRSMTSTG